MSIDAPKRIALDAQASNDLRTQLQKDPKAGIHKAAQEFESMFLQVVLKNMRATVSQDGLMDSEETRFYTGMLDQQMAQDLSKTGKLGFARMMENQFNRALAGSTEATPNAGESGLSTAAKSLLQNLQQIRKDVPSSTLPSNVSPIPTSSLPTGSFSGNSASDGVSSVSNNLLGRGSGSWSSGNPTDFVNRVWPHAVEVSRVTGIPPQFMVAQAALETGWGKHEMLNQDGSSSYNLFGVKASKSWSGPVAQAETTEFINGQEIRVTASFRSYTSYAEAFRDYANLLRNNPRYGSVIGSQDGTEFANRLQQAGYASDPQYAEKLARIINGPTLRQAIIG
jgi:flagellar protein FlgJ